VILTRQTCSQRSVMAAGGKRQALAFNFSVRIYYMFLVSKCRGQSDLGLCMTPDKNGKMGAGYNNLRRKKEKAAVQRGRGLQLKSA